MEDANADHPEDNKKHKENNKGRNKHRNQKAHPKKGIKFGHVEGIGEEINFMIGEWFHLKSILHTLKDYLENLKREKPMPSLLASVH